MKSESSHNQAVGDFSGPWRISASSFEDVLAVISATLSRMPAGQVSHEMERWLRDVVLMLGVDRVTVGQISPADGLVYTTLEWARDGITHTPRRMNTRETLPWLTDRIMTGEAVVLPNLRDAPPQAAKDLEYARRVGCKSNVTVPMMIGGEVVGAIALDTVTHARLWSERTVQRLRLLGEVFGNAIERERSVCEILRLAQEVRRSSRATGMGELTASLVHELNQPLGAILSNAQAAHRFLAAKKPNLEEVRSAIEEIIHDNSRAVEILRSVRALFRREQVQMSSLDLRQVLLEAESVLSLEARGKGISIRSYFPSRLPTVIGNRTQLLEVLMNLAANAFDSICEDERAPRVVE